MEKIALPLLMASAISLSACCECEVPKSKHQNSSATDVQNDTHDLKQSAKVKDVDAHGEHHIDSMNSISGISKTGNPVVFGNNTITSNSWHHKQHSIGKGTLNFFDGNKVSSANGHLAHHTFVSTKDKNKFSQADFNKAMYDSMQSMGAVEFFSGNLPKTTAKELNAMVGFNSGDYTHIDPTQQTLHQYITDIDGKKVIYQFISDEHRGEVGVFSTESNESNLLAVKQVTTDVLPKELANIETESALSLTEEPTVEKPVDEKVIEVTEEKPINETEEAAEQPVKLANNDQDKTISKESMQSELGNSGAITLNINFDTSKATIREDNIYIIDELHELLRQDPNLKFIIQGHTDDIGEADMNQKLSLARAKEVKAELEKKGIESNRLKAEGYGESKPVVKNNNAENRAQNRRVELVKF